jgi:hypothetical protein
MLASFLGVLPILTPPLCALAFIMWNSNFYYGASEERGTRDAHIDRRVPWHRLVLSLWFSGTSAGYLSGWKHMHSCCLSPPDPEALCPVSPHAWYKGANQRGPS